MLTLIRGLPGSGKSTLALSMLNANTKHFEADMFRIGKDGVYRFNSDQNIDAFMWCEEQSYKALKEGFNVIVSNTFTRALEMVPYLDLASELKWTHPDLFKTDIPVRVITCTGKFKSIHNVPNDKIQAMVDRWEQYPGEEFYNA